jgi:DNA-binding transcriptional MerR regulator
MAVRRGIAPARPVDLGQYFAPAHHEDLALHIERWRRHGISLEKIESEIRLYTQTEAVIQRRRPRWKEQASSFRKVREDLVAVLGRARSTYQRHPGRPRSPLDRCAAEMLAYLNAAARVGLGEKVEGVAVDFSDILIPPIPGRRGPRSTEMARSGLAELGLGRRDITWIVSNARTPKP